MSKMSQLHAELTEQAAELGFDSIEQAEACGYKVEYLEDGAKLLPKDPLELVDKAYEDLDAEEKRCKEAKQIEMVYENLVHTKEMIALVYKPDNVKYTNPIKQITDDKIKEYYYEINKMCCELAERNIMMWQQEDKNED